LTPIRKPRKTSLVLAVTLSSCLVLAACASAQRPAAPVAAADAEERPADPTPGITPLTLEQEEMLSQ
jgi:hypothetical protein